MAQPWMQAIVDWATVGTSHYMCEPLASLQHLTVSTPEGWVAAAHMTMCEAGVYKY
jgi:hypothetical protein